MIQSFKSLFAKQKATIAFNMYPRRGPWGGSSAYVGQMISHLRRLGYRVTFSLSERVDCIVIIDPREDLERKAFGMGEILSYRAQFPEVKVIHRINECDQRKATSFMDPLLEDANHIADFTVFISKWLRDYHASRWFDVSRPHCVIYNGADDRFFHPLGCVAYQGSGPFRLVTHHWSSNPLKGFDVYEQLDGLLSDGALPDVEFWVIGNWPSGLKWRKARTFLPCSGIALANLLRQCHAYITASRWEPCGMHHIEGAQCGLPLIYHEDGGGIVEAGMKYGISYGSDVQHAIQQMKISYRDLRNSLFHNILSGDFMCHEYIKVIQNILCMGDVK